MYHVLTRHGYPKERVIEWLDKIREHGINGSFIKKEKDVNQILEETRYLCAKIDAVLKRGMV